MVYLAAPPHGAHGLKFIVLTQVQSGRVAASLHGIEKKCSKGVLSEWILLISSKMLLHLSKNMHRNSVKKNTEMMLNPGN